MFGEPIQFTASVWIISTTLLNQLHSLSTAEIVVRITCYQPIKLLYMITQYMN